MKQFIFSVLLLLSTSAQAEVCLDYWKIGPNGSCKKPTYDKQPEAKPKDEMPQYRPEPRQERKPSAPQPQGLSLDKKIDEYIEDYEKPPREYVAFHLEPTLENAMRWVKKYRETLSRGSQLAEAWTQAEYLYDRMEAQGVDVDSVVELDKELPQVKGFFKDLKQQDKQGLRFKRDVEQGLVDVPSADSAQDANRIGGRSSQSNSSQGASGPKGKAQYDSQVMNQQMMQFLQEAGVEGEQLDFISRRMKGQSAQEASGIGSVSNSGRIGGQYASPENNSARIGGASAYGKKSKDGRIGGSKEQVTIEYFYSARCPFCRKFEPIFKRVLDEQRADFDVSVACVDITPSIPEGKKAKDLLGCSWRGVTDEEFDAKRIEQTPTLLITWGDGKDQRIEGLVDYGQLSKYFESHK